MWRTLDQERRVLQLDAPEDADPVADRVKQSPPTPSPLPLRLEGPKASLATSSLCPPTETEAADVILHSKKCAFPLHLSVLSVRCPRLYKQIRQLRHPRPRLRQLPIDGNKEGSFALRLIEDAELKMRNLNRTRSSQSEAEDQVHFCPLLKVRKEDRITYVKCVAEHGAAADNQQSPIILQKRKRLRQDPSTITIQEENLPPNRNLAMVEPQRARRARSLFSEDEEALSVATCRVSGQQRGVLHVELLGADVAAVVTVVEYIYRFQVRMLDETKALQAAKLAQWLDMRNSVRYYCLFIAIRHVTPATWMEILLVASTITDSAMRRVLCEDLVAFLGRISPEQYYQALTDMRMVLLSLLKDHDMLVYAAVGLINNVRLLELWRNVLDGLNKWLCKKFQTPEPPSLRDMHRYFAPEWKPYMECGVVEIKAGSGQGNLYTLLEFGKFQLQVRVDILDAMPIVWRIIRSSSPNLLTPEPDELDSPAALDNDPEFWIRGQMKVKYWRAHSDLEISEEVVIEYQHCYQQYSQWSELVPATPSTLAPAVTIPALPADGVGRAQFRGKFFLWGDPVCSLYHFLLHTTLFYAAPHSASSELVDLMTISEMQRLPVETLILVLRSDRLRIPGGEQTLLRCLNEMVFGNTYNHLRAGSQTSLDFNGRAKDVIRLYKCVRWCFVPTDDIIATLRRSPRELKFYELIVKGLQDTFRRFHRRRPWGWRNYRHAYMNNETNLIEFLIEAGENHLSPEYFPKAYTLDKLSQDSVSSPSAVSYDPPRVQSLP
ncbi:hypothetical protein PHYBOEH_006588 [Phytophthora boehmeriae]|uniref:BTB domain-containing protein n=1 Tax=Phytophthora boehmeriae TaxID=109152 RepID=A0A8T1WF54_9STRA|nr:hypothetical protein PHYBOEH_006588 [Phytophthora boehmeriae]